MIEKKKFRKFFHNSSLEYRKEAYSEACQWPNTKETEFTLRYVQRGTEQTEL